MTRLLILTIALIPVFPACDEPKENQNNSTQEISETNKLSKEEIIQIRRQFEVAVLSFDAKQKFGSEFPYSDYVRLQIKNTSDVTLPCLTILTKRYKNGEMVGFSRAPSISTKDLLSGQVVEYDYYPKGHLDIDVDNITVEIEGIINPETEEFFCELNN